MFLKRMLLNLVFFMLFAALIPEFRTLGSFIGFVLGIGIMEYVSYKLTSEE